PCHISVSHQFIFSHVLFSFVYSQASHCVAFFNRKLHIFIQYCLCFYTFFTALSRRYADLFVSHCEYMSRPSFFHIYLLYFFTFSGNYNCLVIGEPHIKKPCRFSEPYIAALASQHHSYHHCAVSFGCC